MARRRRRQFDPLLSMSDPGQVDYGDMSSLDPMAGMSANLDPMAQSPEPRDEEPQFHMRRYNDGPDWTPPMSPEEESGLLGNIMGGVEYLGSTLDKPGAAVRGLMAGQPEQLLNLIPFSDTMGLTDPATRVTGRDLLEKAGIANENQPGLFNSPSDFAGDVGGFLTEVATDPLTWMTGPLGSLTKAGKGAARGTEKLAETSADFGKAMKQLAAETPVTRQVMGNTPADIAGQFRRGERSVAGFHVPFTDRFDAALPMPQWANDLTAGAIEKSTYGKYSPIQLLRGAISHTTGGHYRWADQIERDLAYSAKEAAENRVRDVIPAIRDRQKELSTAFSKMAEHHGKLGDPTSYQAFEREMLELGENMPKADGLMSALRERWNLPADAPMEEVLDSAEGLGGKFHEYFDQLGTTVRKAGEDYKALGGNLELLDDDYVSYYPRHLSKSLLDTINKKREAENLAPIAGSHDFWKERRKAYRNYPGGTVNENRIAMDRTFMGVNQEGKQLSRAEHKAAMQNELGIGTPQAKFEDIQRQYFLDKHYKPDMAEAVRKGILTQEDADKAIAEFTLPTHTETIKGGIQQVPTDGRATVDHVIDSYNKLPKQVVNTGLFDRTAAEDWLGYMQSIVEKQATLRHAHVFLKQPGVVGDAIEGVPLVDAWKAAGMRPEGLETFVKDNPALAGKFDPENVGEYVRSLNIAPSAAGTLKAFGQLTEPANLNEIGKMVDRVNATYKGLLTTSPAFHVRNSGAGFWSNLANGILSVKELVRGNLDILKWMKGDTKGMELLDEGLALGLMGPHGMALDTLGSAPEFTSPLKGWGEVGKSMKDWRNWNPLAVRGGMFRDAAGESRSGVFAQVQDKMYNLVELQNRGSAYVAMRRKGLTPSEALHHVERAQFNYSKLSPFEKSVMRRAVPFYAWTRKSIPYSLQKILERPGGITSQSIRLESQGNEKGEYVPAFLREGMNVPLGGPENAKSFLRQGGLPIEDLNSFIFKGGLPNVGRTYEKFMSKVHPLAIAPTELAADKQFFTGRKLSDLTSMTGNRVLDAVLHYQPLSRQIGDFRSVTDSRKTLMEKLANEVTGFKAGTYDVGKLKENDMKKAQEEILASDPLIRSYDQYYRPKSFKDDPNAAKTDLALKRLRQIVQTKKKNDARRAALLQAQTQQ